MLPEMQNYIISGPNIFKIVTIFANEFIKASFNLNTELLAHIFTNISVVFPKQNKGNFLIVFNCGWQFKMIAHNSYLPVHSQTLAICIGAIHATTVLCWPAYFFFSLK